jgi:hypothetical protein
MCDKNKRCATCVHWRQQRQECTAIEVEVGKFRDADKQSYVSDPVIGVKVADDYGLGVCFQTPASFGCTLWTPIE